MLTDDQIEKMALAHECCGHGFAGQEGAFHGFEPEGLVAFVRAIEAAVIEAYAAECETRHANWNPKHLHPEDCAAALREMKTC